MIIDCNNNFMNDDILNEEDYIPKGFVPESEANMEFVKIGDKYLIKNSGGRIVSEDEKLQLEKNELVLEDISANECQEETTKKIKKIKKQVKNIEEIDKEEQEPIIVEDNATNKETI